MSEVMIFLDETADYFLDEEISELDRKCRLDDIVELSDGEIEEIKKGLNDYEKLQRKMEKLRKTRKVKKGD